MSHRSVGFSLVEICGVTAVVGVVTAAALTLVPSWLDNAHQTASTTSLVALLRDTQQRAVADGRTMCVDLDLAARAWSVRRGVCAADRDGITFFADGSATPGSFVLGSDILTVGSSGSAAVS